MIPHKTYIAHITAFFYYVGFHRRNMLESSGFHGIIFHQALYFCITTIFMSILIWTHTECFHVHFKYICKFAIKYYNLTLYSFISTPAINFEEMEPMFVIHNISIATADDIIHIDDDVNIYPVYLFWTTIILGNFLDWLGKAFVSDHIFVNVLRADLGTHSWPLSVFS